MVEFKPTTGQFKVDGCFFSNSEFDSNRYAYMQYLAPESGTYEYLNVDGKTIKKFHHEGEVITVRVNKDDKNRDD